MHTAERLKQLRLHPSYSKSAPQLNYRFFTDVQGTIIMFDVSDKQTLVNALSDRGSNRGRRRKSWLKEVDYRAEDDNQPVKILG